MGKCKQTELAEIVERNNFKFFNLSTQLFINTTIIIQRRNIFNSSIGIKFDSEKIFHFSMIISK